MKYILVTGGVISGIGKGIIASSVGTILKSCGLHVTAIKIDPYINIDAGTFSPYEHGEFLSSSFMDLLMSSSAAEGACGRSGGLIHLWICDGGLSRSQGKSLFLMMAGKWIWTWGTMSASWTSVSPETTTSPLERSTSRSSARRGGETTWARRCRVSHVAGLLFTGWERSLLVSPFPNDPW